MPKRPSAVGQAMSSSSMLQADWAALLSGPPRIGPSKCDSPLTIICRGPGGSVSFASSSFWPNRRPENVTFRWNCGTTITSALITTIAAVRAEIRSRQPRRACRNSTSGPMNPALIFTIAATAR
jgi:hypothetical protein